MSGRSDASVESRIARAPAESFAAARCCARATTWVTAGVDWPRASYVTRAIPASAMRKGFIMSRRSTSGRLTHRENGALEDAFFRRAAGVLECAVGGMEG